MAAYALLSKAFCLKTIVLPIVKLTDISIGSTAADPGVIDASGGGDGGGVTNPVAPPRAVPPLQMGMAAVGLEVTLRARLARPRLGPVRLATSDSDLSFPL